MKIAEFIEREPYEKGFSEFYKLKIVPALETVELERGKLLAVCKARGMKMAPWFALIFVFALILEITAFNARYPLVFFQYAIEISFFICIWIFFPLATFKNEIKSKILPIVCSFFGDLKYEMKPDQNSNDISSLPIFPNFDSVKSEDLIYGTYKNINLNIREMKFTKFSGKRNAVPFHGIVLVIVFPKPFNGVTIVRRDKGSMINILDSFGLAQEMQKITLEDPKFESVFEVYGTDQVESRFLLSTAFMERILTLSELHSKIKQTGRAVQCEFIDNKLVIAMPSSRNLFEPRSYFGESFSIEDLHIFLKQMNEIFSLVDTLKL